MKIAVIFQVPSPGGLTRFTHAIIEGLLAADPVVAIDYFVADRLLTSGRVPAFSDRNRVRVVPLGDPDVVDSNLDERHGIVQWLNMRLSNYPRLHAAARAAYLGAWPAATRLLRGRRAKHWYEFALPPDLLRNLATYDLVYFPFPYYIDPAFVPAPVVGTFHDVNHKHFPENFEPVLRQQMDRQMEFWTERADAVVVSTHFIESDVLQFYPGAAQKTSVVYVPPYNVTPLTEDARTSALARFGLRDHAFILYPSNHAYHKNLLGLVAAAGALKRRNGSLEFPVVFTGFNTDKIGAGNVRSFIALDAFLKSSSLVVGEDIRGLGFVTDEEVDSLTRSARIVVSTSLYEAGCGPALDAWQFGVPVAFSNIPPFLEQMQALDVEAWVFDPNDPQDIAQTLSTALANREGSLSMARRSRRAIAGHTWRLAGESYLQIFQQAIARHRSATQPTA
jgi:glycosyltransferase involved in cell wall biosynthesis